MKPNRIIFGLLLLIPLLAHGRTFKVGGATINYDKNESYQVVRAIGDLKHDIRLVAGDKRQNAEGQIVVGTYGQSKLIRQLIAKKLINEQDLKGKWESYVITVTDEKHPRLVIAGSDKRGTIYGIYDVTQRIGVSPWYWWADVPVARDPDALVDCDYYASGEPTVKYRGIFINDEDWGLKPWASTNYEKSLGDIGPKTYAKVCELLLRLKANMLAPAMHPCTGAFYSHPENKVVADSFGIIITTSHCEPLLLNNAAKSEWDVEKDGDWNYTTNAEAIRQKWDQRLSEAARYENIYTVAMRGLHDAGLRGDIPKEQRVTLLEQVVSDQRQLLRKHIGRPAATIPQIFVPYKETMDIYEDGLHVPDDVTLVWVDDNYGYMKRVSNPEEQRRKGHSGVYYHLSYLGAPHDYLWLNTTPPVLMYEELKKAYDTGADRYWLLNVGDIKPMELGIQTFMDMAWDFDAFDYDKAYRHQARWLAKTFSTLPEEEIQAILDTYYRLAWTRKPEFMGYEYEWDDANHSMLHDTEFPFFNGKGWLRLTEYQEIAEKVQRIVPQEARDAWFQLMEFPVCAAYQMNRKFLMAQLNHEQAGKLNAGTANWAARQMNIAYDSIQSLNERYNRQCHGKWDGIMSLPTGWCALYQEKPPVTLNTQEGEEEPVPVSPVNDGISIDLSAPISSSDGIRLIKGIGKDWIAVQMNDPVGCVNDITSQESPCITYPFACEGRDSITVVLATVPCWPLYSGRENRVGVSVDNEKPQVFNNLFAEYSRSWKDQVLRNEASCRLRFPINPHRKNHTLKLITGDPGVLIQHIRIE